MSDFALLVFYIQLSKIKFHYIHLEFNLFLTLSDDWYMHAIGK